MNFHIISTIDIENCNYTHTHIHTHTHTHTHTHNFATLKFEWQ